MKKYW